MMNAHMIVLKQIAESARQLLESTSTAEYRRDAQHNIPPGYPEALALIAMAVARRLQAAGTGREDALALGFAAAEEVRFTFGKQNIYIPGEADDAAAQEERIFAEFTGNNYEALAAQYRVSAITIRHIVKRCQNKARKGRQEGLFSEG